MKAEGPRSGRPNSPGAPSSGLVLFAMREERDPFLARARDAGWCLRRRPGSQGRCHELLAPRFRAEIRLTGPGDLNLGEALAAIERPEVLIHPGFAGALRAGLERGAVLRIGTTGRGDAVAEVRESALGGCLRHLEEARIVSVPAPAGREEKMRMAADGSADLVDMESASVHDFCRARGIPYLGLRAVSDRIDDVLPPALIEAWDGRRFRVGHLISRAIVDLGLLRVLLGLRRASLAASASLATELMRLLGD